MPPAGDGHQRGMSTAIGVILFIIGTGSLVASVERAPEPESAPEAAPEPEAAAQAAPPEAPQTEEPPAGAGHTHTVPVVSHSDLVTHIRSEHPGLESGGSTIQMRLLHERAHAD
jgi:hypothetical protein